MNETKKFLIRYVFIVSTCYAGIVLKPTDPVKTDLVDATVKILRSCYGNRITPVGLAGNSSEVITQILTSQEALAVTTIDAEARVEDNGPVLSGHRYKLQVFVVTASSPTTLTRTLEHIKASLWWNHMAVFLILDWSPLDRGCSNAFEMLWAAWEMDLLNARLICHHRTRNRLIYTFNPYTRQAPHPWQFHKTYNVKNNHPWTLFVRGYEKDDEEVCRELDFEKTNDLGGYEIRVSVAGGSCGTEPTRSETSPSGILESIICGILFPALKATPKVLMHSSVNDIGFVNKNGSVSGILREVVLGLSDFAAFPRFLTSMSNLTTTYPYDEADVRAITQYRGYQSQLSKIASVIDTYSRYGLLLVILITISYFKYFVRQSVGESVLSALRIICNSCLPTIPRRLASRIYLGSLFLFTLTIQGIYQGSWASLLTHEKPLRNVKTMTDLAELDYTIYGPESTVKFFNGPAFDGRYVRVQGVECVEYALKNSKAACISIAVLLLYDSAKSQLHLSNPIVPVPVTLSIRPDWPLEDRVNTLLMRSVESYRVQYLYDNATASLWNLVESQENAYRDQTAKVLTLQQLKFAFAILGIGTGFATICFILEVIVG